MKKYFFFFFLIMTISLFAQEKDYQLTYDVHRKVEYPKEAIEGFDINLEELNKSASSTKTIDVYVGKGYSLLETQKKINNNQGEGGSDMPLRPEWLLNDYQNKLTYENFEYFQVPLKYTLKEPTLTPTRNTKKIINLEAKEYTLEDEKYYYSVWLTKLKDLSGSPLYYQFKGYLVLEVKMIGKIIDAKSPKQELLYVLKEIKEIKPKSYEKLIPKKTTTPEESKLLKLAVPITDSEGVDKK